MNRTEPAVELQWIRVGDAEDLPLPEPATAGAAGFDLRARVEGCVDLQPGERKLIPTGIAIALPEGYEAQVRPRSGLALRHGLTLLNSPGTIDADYRGEIGVIAINHGDATLTLRRGERIAQLIVQSVPRITVREATRLPDSIRGSGGFGHTGTD